MSSNTPPHKIGSPFSYWALAWVLSLLFIGIISVAIEFETTEIDRALLVGTIIGLFFSGWTLLILQDPSGTDSENN